MSEFDDEPKVVDRGVRLYELLVSEANAGRPTGIGYAAFLARVHGAHNIRELKGRNFVPRDLREVFALSAKITEAAGGRKDVSRNGVTISTAMDTFIWSAAPPYDRPKAAWGSANGVTHYTREDWKQVFPDGQRSLVSFQDDS